MNTLQLFFLVNLPFLFRACKFDRWSGELDCSKRNLRRVSDFRVPHNDRRFVRYIDLSHNSITAVDAYAFKSLPNLREIRLNDNALSERTVDKLAFAELMSLESLEMNGNAFNVVPSDLKLKRKKRLKSLILARNNIKSLDYTTFEDYTSLEFINLQFNKISDIDNRTFEAVSAKNLDIDLRGNRLASVPLAIKSLSNLDHLDLRDNFIRSLGEDEFAGMASLREMHLFDEEEAGKNPKVKIHKNAFRFMPKLEILYLHYKECELDEFPNIDGTFSLLEVSVHSINDLKMPDSFCDIAAGLHSIFVKTSQMTDFPMLSKCRHLQTINFSGNHIANIPAKALYGLQVEYIEIFTRNSGIRSVHPDAFANLPRLKELDLGHLRIGRFPNLSGTSSLRRLVVSRCGIREVASDLCTTLPLIEELDLSSNNILRLLDLNKCRKLKRLDVAHNQIISIDGKLQELSKLEQLNANDNVIKSLGKDTFKRCRALSQIHLSRNLINTIHPEAFGSIASLKEIDLSDNKLTSIPSKGLQSVYAINVKGNRDMHKFLTSEQLPYAVQLTLEYPYHCCFFANRPAPKREGKMIVRPRSSITSEFTIPSRAFQNLTSMVRRQEISEDEIGEKLKSMNKGTKIIQKGSRALKFEDSMLGESFCRPTPNAFYPCEDLFGKNWLRMCVWIVFLLALTGNVIVVTVLSVNFKKLDVPQYLIINLAFSDLCLGVYLGFLAVVDLYTLGDFRTHALEWQFSGNCKAAGFLAVFASELSVYTLTVITVERYTTIKNAMRTEKKMTKRQTAIIVAVGWFVSLVIAVLPLLEFGEFRFNDYTKYSVCLPFETDSISSKVYLVTVLTVNMLAFLVIVACYVKIYMSISRSNAWNSGDSRCARRMSILIITDFVCWFPIALVSLSVIFENSFFHDLWISKVLTIFVFPLNACANPFLYAILTKKFRKNILNAFQKFKHSSIYMKETQKVLRTSALKNSMTFSTSVRRGSSCSFLFGRRASSKADDLKRTQPAHEEAELKEETRFLDNHQEAHV